MGTATVQTKIFSSLKTGAGMNYPVLMKCPFDYSDYVFRHEVKDDDEVAIGDIVIVDANKLIDASGSATTVAFIVLDTPWNKSVLEGHGLTVNKTSQFKDGDQIDLLLLVPGMICSMKVEAKADMVVGTSLLANDTAGQLTGGTTAGSVLGISLGILDWTDVSDELFYLPVLIK